jgi:hypothetical protein
MRMLDLFCGLGGASAAFRDVGWEVIGVDIEPKFKPEVVADLTTWHWDGGPVDLVWASPPCVEFSRKSMPCWYPDDPEPSMELVEAARRIIREVKPTWWVIENVRGAVPYIGEPRQRAGAFMLWGNFPDLGVVDGFKNIDHVRSPAKRAIIPHAISDRLLYAITNQPRLDI